MNMAYKSTLRANLITIHYEKPILTAKALAESGMNVYVPGQTTISQAVLSHPSSHYKKLIKDDRLKTYQHGTTLNQTDVVKIGSKKAMFGVEDKFLIGTELVGGSYTTWFLNKGSPLFEELNLNMRRLIDSGIPNRLNDLMERMGIKPKSNPMVLVADDDEPIRLEQIMIMVFVLPFGIIPAILAFIYEMNYF